MSKKVDEMDNQVDNESESKSDKKWLYGTSYREGKSIAELVEHRYKTELLEEVKELYRTFTGEELSDDKLEQLKDEVFGKYQVNKIAEVLSKVEKNGKRKVVESENGVDMKEGNLSEVEVPMRWIMAIRSFMRSGKPYVVVREDGMSPEEVHNELSRAIEKQSLFPKVRTVVSGEGSKKEAWLLFNKDM